MIIESEERFALAIRGANVGIWDWDIKESRAYYSPIWKSILGYEEHEIGYHFSDATDLLHPYDKDNVLKMFWTFVEGVSEKFYVEFRFQHKSGHYIHLQSHAFSVRDNDNKTLRVVGTLVDISARIQAEEQLSYQSSHDELTGLMNRREFTRCVEKLLTNDICEQSGHALCYIDIDQFKVVNDTCGHAAGDEMLRQLGLELKKALKTRDILARLGGDEFGVLIKSDSIEAARLTASDLLSAIRGYQFAFEGHNFSVSASMGLVNIAGPRNSLEKLLKNADAACYMAKDYGRNRIHVYRADDTDLTQRHGQMQWVNRIQQALNENRFCLYAQSIESLNIGDKGHYELLIRMHDKQGGLIPPGAFLPAAERYNLIGQLDRWVINNAFLLLSENPTFLNSVDFISINLSGHSLTDAGVLNYIISKFELFNVDYHKICFEVTETAAISQLSMAEKFIVELKKLGCRFALDDFGSGLSSFGYLKNLPVDYLKIDGMFVKNIVDDKIDHAMVKSINDIGHVMGMQTIAEFVENDRIKFMLKDLGVDYAQGYGIHKPQLFAELLACYQNNGK